MAIFGLSIILTACNLGTPEAVFRGDREKMFCDGVFPQCQGKSGNCILDEYHYLTGNFPGTRRFIVETLPGDWVIKVLLFLDDRQYPGTETEIIWNEPGCKDQYRYLLSKDTEIGDLFQQAGAEQVFAKERPVVEAGDHLIEIYSDSTTRYDLRVEIHLRN